MREYRKRSGAGPREEWKPWRSGEPASRQPAAPATTNHAGDPQPGLPGLPTPAHAKTEHKTQETHINSTNSQNDNPPARNTHGGDAHTPILCDLHTPHMHRARTPCPNTVWREGFHPTPFFVTTNTQPTHTTHTPFGGCGGEGGV